MKKISLAFFGAPDFAANVLKTILSDPNLPITVQFVITQPDRKAGRKQILTPTPVKLLAQEYTIPVFETLHAAQVALHEVDLALLYAYGEIIPLEILKIPSWGFWNIHPSLLPLYRGPSPLVYPPLLGEKKTGVSLIQMDERMDHGPIIDQEEYSLQQTDTQEILKNRLSDIGYKLFKQNIQLLIDGALQKKEQIHINATYTRLLTKQDGFIPFSVVQTILKNENPIISELPPIIQEYYKKYPPLPTNHYSLTTYYNLFRALSPWPGIWTVIPTRGVEKRLKITKMELENNVPKIIRVQLEGKNEISLSTFLAAYPLL